MTRINDISKEIQKQLQYYAKDVAEKVEVAKKDTANDIARDIKENSPKNRPRYHKGWKTKKTKKGWIVHNKTDYQLTHLLEHGHLQRNGDRFQGKVHIRPAEEKGIREYMKKIERAIEK